MLCLWAAASCRAQPAADKKSDIASQLWRNFLEKYREFSLAPLSAEDLDGKARAMLISTAGPKFRSWKPDAHPDFLTLLGAMAAQDSAVPSFRRIEQTLEKLLPQIDTYGNYKMAEDVAQWQEALRQNPGSVHLTLDQATDGRVLCYPLADGPAEKAGIRAGAELISVDQRPAAGKSISALRLAFVGPPQTQIQLEVRQPQGKTEVFSVTRTDQAAPTISVVKTPVGLTLRVRRFDPGSAALIKSQLEPYPQPNRLTIDLRGNPGGLRDEALKVASLFLPKGSPIGQFTTRSGTQNANDGNDIACQPGAIQILQDARTASAAEYLIATLRENLPGKVSLFGSKTYGKSHSTVHITLEGGGELVVTEALLSTASGKSWEKQGISADEEKK